MTLRRGAANALTRRNQAVHPRAHLVPDRIGDHGKAVERRDGRLSGAVEEEGVPVTSIPSSPEVRTAQAFSLDNDSG